MQIRKILLAVDPFADEPGVGAEKIARSVQGFVRNQDTFVEAVYVMTPNGVGLALEKLPEHLEHYKKLATDRLKSAVGDFGKNVSTNITVLPQGSNSVRAGVESLLKHVAKQGADLIAVSTHAKKGVDRFFLGSFAESLLLRTTVPVLITNPTTPWDPAFHHILFTTDFSEESSEAFNSAISIAKQLGARMTLFHRLDPESALLPPLGFIAVQEWRNRKIDRQTKALKLKEKAEREGVQIDVEIDTQNHRVAPAILGAATRLQASLIVIGARQSSELLAMGGIPRQIVRDARCPVLVLPTAKR